MNKLSLSQHALLAVVFLSLLLLAAAGICSRVSSSPETVEHARYYRAVHVLQHLSVHAAEEPEAIPMRVAYDDATESMLHHSDRIQVLKRIANDLASYRSEMPRAALYESYARLALGDRKQATYILTRYVVENTYEPRHYALLCQNLHEQGDHASLLLMCREWAERDKTLRKDRARYLWIALYNLGRFEDAEQSLDEHADCLGWRALVYSAKTALAQGNAAEAEKLYQKAVNAYSDKSIQIKRLWDKLKSTDHV
ncbi:hypothetical protein LJC46_00785 [Desulfovibrio sp. OttesenSCG-928-G15]|nr:hypothetical protein [Desulfovibrio sp. OttesenSCG-928-G15]